jgi:hypothetical protein
MVAIAVGEISYENPGVQENEMGRVASGIVATVVTIGVAVLVVVGNAVTVGIAVAV